MEILIDTQVATLIQIVQANEPTFIPSSPSTFTTFTILQRPLYQTKNAIIAHCVFQRIRVLGAHQRALKQDFE